MKVWVAAVGQPHRRLAPAIAEFEKRAGRYWKLETILLRQARGASPTEVREREAERILGRLPQGAELIALTRTGDACGSEALARRLHERALHGHPGTFFAIGGAFGLSGEFLERADTLLSLSSLTLPHDLARLVLAEQLYRAGTIVRGEPYHKGFKRGR